MGELDGKVAVITGAGSGMARASTRVFVDAVLNVAGIGGAQPLAKVTMDEYDRIMAVDLKGVLLGTKHGITAMLPTGGGSIVNWSSIGGMNASVMPTSVYSAAKAGVISFTKSTAVEYGAGVSGPTRSAPASS